MGEKRRVDLYKTQPLLISRKIPWGCSYQHIHLKSLRGWHQIEHGVEGRWEQSCLKLEE